METSVIHTRFRTNPFSAHHSALLSDRWEPCSRFKTNWVCNHKWHDLGQCKDPFRLEIIHEHPSYLDSWSQIPPPSTDQIVLSTALALQQIIWCTLYLNEGIYFSVWRLVWICLSMLLDILIWMKTNWFWDVLSLSLILYWLSWFTIHFS